MSNIQILFKQLFQDQLEIFPMSKVVDAAFKSKMKWLQLNPIKDETNKQIGLLWSLSDCIRKQLDTPSIRTAQKWYSVVDKTDNSKVIVDYLMYSKVPTDTVVFRSTKRANTASTYTNCCIDGTALTYKCADLVALSNVSEGYTTSILHQRPIDKQIKVLHYVGEM